jgi:hypothetical protein
MGCTEAKTSSEETAVLYAEKGLNLHSAEATQVDSVIRKYAYNGKVNLNQLCRIADSLGMNITNSPPNTNIEVVFSSLIASDGTYDLKDLLIVGILLAKGKPLIKACLLFQVFDEDLLNALPISLIKEEIMPKIFDICCVLLPKLVANEQSVVSNPVRNMKYIQDMSSAKHLCIEEVSSKILKNGEIVSESSFSYVLNQFAEGTLTTSTGWRRFAFDMFVANPVKKSFPNPYKNPPTIANHHNKES